ncbi:MAG: hypothetical protein CMH79_00150 [Nitrospinae bacterium]|nr:hypothetical protein [Nitrospinota bacterium]
MWNNLSYLIDILIMWYLIYQVYKRFNNSHAMQLLIRIVSIWVCYFISKHFGLHLTSFLLWLVCITFLILFLISFQNDIRKISSEINPLVRIIAMIRKVFKFTPSNNKLSILGDSTFQLLEKGLGAIIIIERKEDLDSIFRSPGEKIDAEIRTALMESIFNSTSPYHDGAIHIRNGKISRVGCILPLSESQDIPASYGTRHRAALGVTESSDALAIIVSEERKEIAVIENGEITKIDTIEQLSEWIMLRTKPNENSLDFKNQFTVTNLTNNWKSKIFILLCLILLSSFGIDEKVTPSNILSNFSESETARYKVPISFYNIPKNLDLELDSFKVIELQVSGRKNILNFLDEEKLMIRLNLKNSNPGENSYRISSQDVIIPDSLKIVSFSPKKVFYRLKTKN